MLDALADHFGDAIEVQGSQAGLHVVVWFNTVDAAQEGEIARRGGQKGVGVYPISGLYADERVGAATRRAGFVFGYAALEDGEIRKGIARLAEALRTG